MKNPRKEVKFLLQRAEFECQVIHPSEFGLEQCSGEFDDKSVNIRKELHILKCCWDPPHG